MYRIRRPVTREPCYHSRVVIYLLTKNEFKSRYLFSPQTHHHRLLVFIMSYAKYISFGVTRTMSSTLRAEYIITTRIQRSFIYTVGRIYGLLVLCSVFIVIGIGRDLYNSWVGKTCLRTRARADTGTLHTLIKLYVCLLHYVY